MLPSALEHLEEIVRAGDRHFAIFLDYDGTLTPIVSDPGKALLPDSMRQTLQALADYTSLAILSGRDLDDVRRRVNIDKIVYAGSHGFDIAGPRELRKEVATEFLPRLDGAEDDLRKKLAGIPGVRVERKRFSVAAHYREINESNFPKVQRTVNQVARRYRELRIMEGKKVYELQPNIDWDKGKAVLWLLKTLELDRGIYIGDDRTDEDAFRALEQKGMGILVTEPPRLTAAHYSLREPMEVEQFLRGLVAALA